MSDAERRLRHKRGRWGRWRRERREGLARPSFAPLLLLYVFLLFFLSLLADLEKSNSDGRAP